MSKLLSRMLAVAFTASLSFSAGAEQSNKSASDAAPIGEKPSNPTSQGSSDLDRVNEKAGDTSSKKGVSGRAGTSGTDAAPIGEKPSNPTSQGSSDLDNEKAGGSSGSTPK